MQHRVPAGVEQGSEKDGTAGIGKHASLKDEDRGMPRERER
jgi:hypothetical protein